MTDLNHLYKNQIALHKYDFDDFGFEWLDCDDTEQSILSYMRKSEDDCIIVILNFTPVIRKKYRVGLPSAGKYKIIFNSDSDYYSGSNAGSHSILHSEKIASMNHSHSASITLPPLAGMVIKKVK